METIRWAKVALRRRCNYPRLGLNEARVYARQAIHQFGRDFVYNPCGRLTCLYRPLTPARDTADDTTADPRLLTGCIVGRILDAAGYTQHREQRLPLRGMVSTNGNTIRLTRPAFRYLALLQGAQDAGAAWGEAYDIAEQWTVHRNFGASQKVIVERTPKWLQGDHPGL